MAEIDRAAFGIAVSIALKGRGLSYRQAVTDHPALDKAMLSRACHGERLSAGNYLLLCRILALDPFAFLVERPRLTLKDIAKQAVTQSDKRETQEVSP